MFKRVVLLLALSVAAPSFAADAAPRFQAVKVGAAEVVALQDADMEIAATLFQNPDAAVLAQAMPAGKVMASVNAFLIRAGKTTILVDAGYGETGSRGHLAQTLAAAGVKPEAIDLVVLTHAHSDHTGGLLAGGKPAFPKAKIAFARAEVPTFDDAAIEKMPPQYRPYFTPSNAALKAYGDRVQLLSPGDTLAEGVTVVDLAGHTPGSIGVQVASGKDRLLIVGDVLHVAEVQFAHPELCLVYDGNVEAAVKARRALFTRVAAEKLPIAAAHVPFPGIGTVEVADQAFKFTPVKQAAK